MLRNALQVRAPRRARMIPPGSCWCRGNAAGAPHAHQPGDRSWPCPDWPCPARWCSCPLWPDGTDMFGSQVDAYARAARFQADRLARR